MGETSKDTFRDFIKEATGKYNSNYAQMVGTKVGVFLCRECQEFFNIAHNGYRVMYEYYVAMADYEKHPEKVESLLDREPILRQMILENKYRLSTNPRGESK